jgi:hypothetical protein
VKNARLLRPLDNFTTSEARRPLDAFAALALGFSRNLRY